MSDASTGTAPSAGSRRRAGTRALLQARGIRKSFAIGSRRLEILHGVNLSLDAGERLCLMGSSGAGKSTLMHILGLLEQPSEGEVFLEGRSVWELPLGERARLRNRDLAFVFQFYHLLPELDAVENVLVPAMITHGYFAYRARRGELRERAETLLADCGLKERLRHRPSQLSGGEQQRVAIARALFQEPKVILADEPTGNLDSATGERVLDLLFDLQGRHELSLLIVTHDERVASRCERVIYMDSGQILEDSSNPIPD
jgi:lipoprotein-releasing system ATP-binding protein